LRGKKKGEKKSSKGEGGKPDPDYGRKSGSSNGKVCRKKEKGNLSLEKEGFEGEGSASRKVTGGLKRF